MSSHPNMSKHYTKSEGYNSKEYDDSYDDEKQCSGSRGSNPKLSIGKSLSNNSNKIHKSISKSKNGSVSKKLSASSRGRKGRKTTDFHKYT